MDIKQIIKSPKLFFILNSILLLILILSLGARQIMITKTYEALGIKKSILKQITSLFSKKESLPLSSNQTQLSGDLAQDAIKLVVSQGVPEIYGSELGISFDQVQQSMNIMLQYDPTNGQKKVTLTGDNLKRYIDIGLKIACEYCCGAKGLVFENGEAACGCAHSQAMRGLAAYLIQNHPNQFSDDQILKELARWKGMYFPKQMIQKLATQLQNGNFTPDILALILGVELPDYGQGSKVPLPSEIENLPGMVGGC